MRCPRCGLEAPEFRYGCSNCGWMHTIRRDSTDSADENEYDVTLGQWVVCWIIGIPFILIFVVGPYLALLILNPPFVHERLFHTVYWTGWPLYLLIAYLVESDPPRKNQGYFGMLIPPPRHMGDDLKKGLRTLLILCLAPGKIIIAAMLATPRYVILAMKLRSKNRRLRYEMPERQAVGVGASESSASRQAATVHPAKCRVVGRH